MDEADILPLRQTVDWKLNWKNSEERQEPYPHGRRTTMLVTCGEVVCSPGAAFTISIIFTSCSSELRLAVSSRVQRLRESTAVESGPFLWAAELKSFKGLKAPCVHLGHMFLHNSFQVFSPLYTLSKFASSNILSSCDTNINLYYHQLIKKIGTI